MLKKKKNLQCCNSAKYYIYIYKNKFFGRILTKSKEMLATCPHELQMALCKGRWLEKLYKHTVLLIFLKKKGKN